MKAVRRLLTIASVAVAALVGASSSPAASIIGGPLQLVIQGQTFSNLQLLGINAEIVPTEYRYSRPPHGVSIHTKQYGKTKPPTVVFTMPLSNGSGYFYGWLDRSRHGSATGRQDVLIKLTDAAGGSLFTWELMGARPTKIEVSGAKAGATNVATVKVTLGAEQIYTAPSGAPALPGAMGTKAPTTPGGTAGILSGVACSSPTACTAVGRQTTTSGVKKPLVERWNGSVWNPEGAPLPAGAVGALLSAVACPSSGACTAVGSWRGQGGAVHTLAEAWNGTSWTVQNSIDVKGPSTSALTGVSCPTATQCEAVGFASGPKATVAIAEVSSGGVWALQRVPIPNVYGPIRTRFTSVSCTSATSCTAVGADGSLALAEHFNGTAWSVQAARVPSGAAATVLNSVSCTATGGCIAAGSSTSALGATSSLAERSSGSSWTVQSVPQPPGARSSVLNGVSCESATLCFATGAWVTAASRLKLLAESWNGTSWNVIAAPTPAGESGVTFLSVACTLTTTTNCVAVGAAAHPTQTAVMQLL